MYATKSHTNLGIFQVQSRKHAAPKKNCSTDAAGTNGICMENKSLNTPLPFTFGRYIFISPQNFDMFEVKSKAITYIGELVIPVFI